MRTIVWILVGLLLILHQDVWYWDDTTLVFGFIPIGLFYHVLFSLACGGVWALAVVFAWPSHIEEWADEYENQEGLPNPEASGLESPRGGGA